MTTYFPFPDEGSELHYKETQALHILSNTASLRTRAKTIHFNPLQTKGTWKLRQAAQYYLGGSPVHWTLRKKCRLKTKHLLFTNCLVFGRLIIFLSVGFFVILSCYEKQRTRCVKPLAQHLAHC